MSSDFEVPVESASRLYSWDVLTSNLRTEMGDAVKTPVLFDDDIHYFHDVEGGYDKQNDQHVVTLLHRVQGKGTPPNDPTAASVEIHTPDSFYTLTIDDITHWDRDYPDESYALTLYVSNYMTDEYTFHDELQADIDGREQEFSYDE